MNNCRYETHSLVPDACLPCEESCFWYGHFIEAGSSERLHAFGSQVSMADFDQQIDLDLPPKLSPIFGTVRQSGKQQGFFGLRKFAIFFFLLLEARNYKIITNYDLRLHFIGGKKLWKRPEVDAGENKASINSFSTWGKVFGEQRRTWKRGIPDHVTSSDASLLDSRSSETSW